MNRNTWMLIGLVSISLAILVECKSSMQMSNPKQQPLQPTMSQQQLHHRRNHRFKYGGVKKATMQKPVKSPKNILDAFKGLPAADIEFLRQLDKQFEKFGNDIRIKVEKENRTTSKNTKRTIESSLGYGYDANHAAAEEANNYYFSKPKFQIYPYSQHDIAPTHEFQQNQQYLRHHQPHALQSSDVESSQHYYQQSHPYEHTSVEIQPSHSYEIKATDHSLEQQDTAEYHHQVPVAAPQPTVPVIVLRIPGPQKYASHLQALLQQYLEIRAAQYIQVLQEQEAQQLQLQQQQQQLHQHQELEHQHQEVQMNVDQAPAAPIVQAYSAEDSYLNQPVENGQIYAATPRAPIALSQQTYGVPQGPQLVEQSDVHSDVSLDTQVKEPDAFIPTVGHEQSPHGQSAAFVYQALHDHAHQQEQIVYGAPRQAVPNPLAGFSAPAHQQQLDASQHLLTSENFPDDKHTQVVFRSSTVQPPSYDYDSSSSLNSHLPDTGAVEVQTFRAPLVYHRLEQFYDNNNHGHFDGDAAAVNAEQHHNGASGGLDDVSSISPTPGNIVTITQRPVLPYNYHAQSGSNSHQHLQQQQLQQQLQQHKFHSHFNGDEYPMLRSNNLYKRSSAKRHVTPHHSDVARASPVERQRKFTNLMHRLKARVAQSTRYDSIPL